MVSIHYRPGKLSRAGPITPAAHHPRPNTIPTTTPLKSILKRPNDISISPTVNKLTGSGGSKVQVLVEIGGQQRTAFIDGGSPICLIHASLTENFKKTPNHVARLRQVQGTLHDEGVIVFVPIKFGQLLVEFPCFAIKDLEDDILIGQDFLERYKIRPDYDRRVSESVLTGDVPWTSPLVDIWKDHGIPITEFPIRRVQTFEMIHSDMSHPPLTHSEMSHPPLTHPRRSLPQITRQNHPPTSSVPHPVAMTQPTQIPKPTKEVPKKPHTKDADASRTFRPHILRIRVSEKTKIPARTRIYVPIQPTGLRRGEECVLKAAARLYHTNRLLIPTMLINDDTAGIIVTNPTTSDIWVCQDTVLGTEIPGATIPDSNLTTDDLQVRHVSTGTEITREDMQKKLDINPNLTQNDKDMLLNVIQKHHKAFAWDPDRMGRTDRLKFTIDTGDHPPKRIRPYPASEQGRKQIREEVKRMLELDLIEPSSSPWSSPVHLVPKKNGSGKRFTTDFRFLNSITTNVTAYPLPRIDDILSTLRDAKYITVMDLKHGFWQIELDEKDREKTAFVTPDAGFFQYKVLPMGLSSSAGHFQFLMDLILSGLKPEVVLSYIDDLIIHSVTLEEHAEKLDKVLARIVEEGLTFQPKKCHIGYPETKVLGFIIGGGQMRLDASVLSGVRDFPRPTTVKETQRALGLFNHYRKFIDGYAHKMTPLYDLLKKDSPFQWGEAQENAFQFAKNSILSEPVLALFQPGFETRLQTDALCVGVVASLSQIHPEGIELAFNCNFTSVGTSANDDR